MAEEADPDPRDPTERVLELSERGPGGSEAGGRGQDRDNKEGAGGSGEARGRHLERPGRHPREQRRGPGV